MDSITLSPLRWRRQLLYSGTGLIAAGAALRAQTPADSAARRSAADSARALAPVVVTVLRTPFRLDRAPYALSVLTTREMQRGRPGLNLAEALVAVPGVQVDNRYNYALGERISVRGFGARAQFGVRGVRIIVDGIPATLPDGQTTLNHVDVAALGRAEVVRGPAASVYGNAAGGVIQLESEPAPAARVSQRVRALAGADGLTRLQSTTAGQVAAGATPVAYTLNVSRLRYGGYRAFSDATNSYLASTVEAGSARGGVRLAVHAADYDARNPGSLSDSLLRADRRQAFRNNVAQRTGEAGRHGELGLSAHHVLGAGELRASVYGVARSLDNPIPNRVIDLDRRAGGARVAYAARLRAGERAVQLVAGSELQAQHDDRQNYLNRAGERGAIALDQAERVTALAGFTQLAAELTSQLSVVGALRYDHTRFAVRDHLVSAANPDDSGERSLPAWSPSLGVTYAVGGGASLYANVSTAFETPTTTELANRPSGAGGFNGELQPQRTRSLEVGGNARLGQHGTVQLAAYTARIRDAFAAFEVPGAPGRQFFRNAGAAEHRGVEAGITLAPARGVELRAAYTLTDARFREYTVGGVSYGGKRVPGIAPHRADAVLSFTSRGGTFAELETRYLSAIPVNDANTPGTRSPAAALANVRVGAQQLRLGALRVAPFAGMTNLFDRDYNTSVVINAFGRRYYEPGPGRGVYAGVELAAGVR